MEPIHLRVNNENHVYATLQFGKRKSNIFLYLQILDNNVCIRKDKVVDIFYKNGEIITLKNDYPLNCEGYFAKELTKKEWQKLMVEEIIMFKVYTFKKNYEIFVSSVESQNINQFINCLSTYKVKEVKKEKKEKK